MNKRIILAFVFTFLLAGCSKFKVYTNNDNILSEEIILKTSDGKKITATFYRGGGNGVVLLHMLGRDRNDWDNFAKILQSLNYSVVAIDLRGHGESEGNWQNFSEEDFRDMVFDVESAVSYLNEKGISNLTIMGASIGANIALNYVADRNINNVILLSPGLNYKGVNTEESIKKYEGRILIVTSKNDKYSYNSSTILFKEAKTKQKQLKIYEGSAHGTEMLELADFSSFILEWLM